MRRMGKMTAGILAGSLCLVAFAGSLYRSQAQGGKSSSQKENALAQVGAQGEATPARGGGMGSEEKTVRDVYARLMRYHTAARDEASAGLGVVYRADDYMIIGVNSLKTGFIEEISNRPLSELVTPRGGEIITLKPNYLRGADGLAHASYGASWGALPEVEKPGQTTGPTVSQAVGEKYKGAVKYTSYEVTVSLEGKRRSYRAMALHFNPGRAGGKPETEVLDNITSEMNTVLAERSPRVRSPWARYVRSNLHEAIVDSIRAKEQAGLPLIPADAPIGYLPGDDIEAANNLLAIAADSCEAPPPPPSVTISDVKAVIKDGFADFQVTLNPSPSSVSVTLNLTTASGAGQALFDATNSSSLTISESTAVRVKGVTESSSVGNIVLAASAGSSTLATRNFTVVTLGLTATGNQEVGKPTHYLSLKSTGDVTITATLTPSGTDASVISWTGGRAGSDNLQRLVDTSSAANTDVSATIGTKSEMVRIHVIDATTPPAAANDATQTHTNGGFVSPGAGFGVVALIPVHGGAFPTYVVNPHFATDRWVFRLASISHSYRLGVHAPGGQHDLPVGNPPSFPLAPGLTLEGSHQEARDDFDVSLLVGGGGSIALGPRRRSYWVRNITQHHEEFHVTDFYSSFWPANMNVFEGTDIEGSSVNVIFDCNDSTTTTGTVVVSVMRTLTWDSRMEDRHTQAYIDFTSGNRHEIQAHTDSNPRYVPIRSAIPIP